MCNPLPGPRCASHTQKQLVTLKAKRDILDQQFSEALKDFLTHDNNPAANRKVQSYRNKVNGIEEKMARVQMDYDGTKTGAAELASQIKNCQDDNERRELIKRQRKASMMRAWRKNAYRLSQEGKLQGNSKQILISA